MLRFEQRVAELPIDLMESSRDDFLQRLKSCIKNSTGILKEKYITGLAVAELISYYVQYLRRLFRSGTLERNKNGQFRVASITAKVCFGTTALLIPGFCW